MLITELCPRRRVTHVKKMSRPLQASKKAEKVWCNLQCPLNRWPNPVRLHTQTHSAISSKTSRWTHVRASPQRHVNGRHDEWTCPVEAAVTLLWVGDRVWSFTQRGETFPAPPLTTESGSSSAFLNLKQVLHQIAFTEKNVSVSITTWMWPLSLRPRHIQQQNSEKDAENTWYTLNFPIDILHITQHSSGLGCNPSVF